ncbi:MAG: ester cyclase [Hyphomicrobiales bacterium]|nr:ester cyclase [Hyphomicrobiales bacterium]
MSDNNKAVIRRMFGEVFNQHRLDLIPECYAEDFCGTDPANGRDIEGHQDLIGLLETYRQAFPDHQYTLHEIVADGDHVAVRWTVQLALPGDHPDVEVEGISMCEFRDGKVVRVWQHYDNLGLLNAINETGKVAMPTLVQQAFLDS